LLSDVGRNGGGFQCLPEVYQNLDAWLERHAFRDDFDFFNPGLNHWKPTQVLGKAGDVILWSARPSTYQTAQGSQRSFPCSPPVDSAQLRESMKNSWLTKRAPDGWRGLPGQMDPESGSPAELSDLGLKLIGVVPW
jgi:hypothetical protein